MEDEVDGMNKRTRAVSVLRLSMAGRWGGGSSVSDWRSVRASGRAGTRVEQ